MWKLREIIERPPFLVAWKCTNSTKREFKWTLFLTHKESQITNFSDSLAFYVCPCSLHPFLHFPSFKSFSHILLHYFVLPFFYLFLFFSIFASHHFIFVINQCHNVVETLLYLCLQLQVTSIVWKFIRDIKNMDTSFRFSFSCRRLFFAALLSLGIIWFMFLTISTMNHQTKRTILVPMNVNVLSRQLKLVSMQRHALHSDSRLVIVSKRRVPNGPDPIHNR
jgi:hypothetical protein